MHDGEIDVAPVGGRFVVLDEAAGPVIGLHDEIIARLHPCNDRDVGMPAVVDRLVLVGGLRKVDFYQCLCHYHLLLAPVALREVSVGTRALVLRPPPYPPPLAGEGRVGGLRRARHGLPRCRDIRGSQPATNCTLTVLATPPRVLPGT